MKKLIYNLNVYEHLNPFLATFFVALDVIMSQIHQNNQRGIAQVLERSQREDLLCQTGQDYLSTEKISSRDTITIQTYSLRLWFMGKDCYGNLIDTEFEEDVSFEKFNTVGSTVPVTFVVSPNVGIISIGLS